MNRLTSDTDGTCKNNLKLRFGIPSETCIHSHSQSFPSLSSSLDHNFSKTFPTIGSQESWVEHSGVLNGGGRTKNLKYVPNAKGLLFRMGNIPQVPQVSANAYQVNSVPFQTIFSGRHSQLLNFLQFLHGFLDYR